MFFMLRHFIKLNFPSSGWVVQLLPNLKRNGYEDNMIIELNFIIQLVDA